MKLKKHNPKSSPVLKKLIKGVRVKKVPTEEIERLEMLETKRLELLSKLKHWRAKTKELEVEAKKAVELKRIIEKKFKELEERIRKLETEKIVKVEVEVSKVLEDLKQKLERLEKNVPKVKKPKEAIVIPEVKKELLPKFEYWKGRAKELEERIKKIGEVKPEIVKDLEGKLRKIEEKVESLEKEVKRLKRREWEEISKGISKALEDLAKKVEGLEKKVVKPKKLEVRKPELTPKSEIRIPIRKMPEERIDLKQVNEWRPLIQIEGKNFAWANIRWEPKEGALVYFVIEPPLTPEDQENIEKIKKLLEQKLDIDFGTLREMRARKYVKEKLLSAIDELELDLSQRKLDVIKYYIIRNFVGLNEIEPFMQDPEIEDISCDGTGFPLFIVHRNPLYGELKTNVMFRDPERLNSFVMKLAQRCGKSISVADPLLDGSLPDGSRVQATYGTGVARRGSNFSIRKFTEKPMSPIDLVNYRTVNTEMLSFFWEMIEHRKSFLVAGTVAVGKTTLLNVLGMFIKPELKVISIEETPEIRFYRENWIPQVSRMGYGPPGPGGKRYGEVTLYDLLKSSLRQRPDYLIVGEVRGREASVMFQGLATGHPGLSTLHADSLEKVVDRLTTRPISLPPSLLDNLDLIIFMIRVKKGEGYIRRVKTVLEVVDYDLEREKLITNPLFRWDPKTDSFVKVGESVLLRRISEDEGIPLRELKEEVKIKKKILDWMKVENISDYREVTKLINQYYKDRESVLKRVK